MSFPRRKDHSILNRILTVTGYAITVKKIQYLFFKGYLLLCFASVVGSYYTIFSSLHSLRFRMRLWMLVRSYPIQFTRRCNCCLFIYFLCSLSGWVVFAMGGLHRVVSSLLDGFSESAYHRWIFILFQGFCWGNLT